MAHPQTEEASLAVLAVKLDHLTGSVDAINRQLETSASVHVTRREWQLRNETVDERHVGLSREIGQLKTEMASRRAPWWAVVALIGGVGSLMWQVLGPTIVALP